MLFNVNDLIGCGGEHQPIRILLNLRKEPWRSVEGYPRKLSQKELWRAAEGTEETHGRLP